VLFVIVNLSIPDLLLQGRMTAHQLAAAAGCNQQVEWLDRVLKAAAALGVVSKRRRTKAQQRAAAAARGDPAVDPLTCVDDFEYYANALTACLCRNHKSSVRAMVQLYDYNYTSATALTKVRRCMDGRGRTLLPT